jgi:peptidoglycan/LPS O-acetylase OafA/YrhL
MDKHFSLYLDLVRFVAALLVVLTHYIQHGIFGKQLQIAGYNPGREAVIVFFVLSGFVIAYTSTEKVATLRDYVVARGARIYSVTLPILLAAFSAGLAASLVPGVTVESGYQLLKPYLYLPLHLLFMGQLWTLSETPPWLAPYWSLCYEVWYYVLFGVAFYARGAWRLALAALVLLVMGPKLLLLLPVWLAGACLYRYQRSLSITLRQARLGVLATLATLALYKVLELDLALRAFGIALWPFPSLPLGSADRYLSDYVVCIFIYLHFVFARQARLTLPAALHRPIRTLASYTFTLYLVHGLVMGLWSQFYRHDPASLLDSLLLTACIGAATYACGFVTEKRRDWFQHRLDALYALSVRRLA